MAPFRDLHLFRQFAAVAHRFLIGIERERKEKPAGLKTLTLICVGAAIFTLASRFLADDRSDVTRITAQIIPGIGFLGAGAILRSRGSIVGLTTAATIWVVAAIGMMIGGMRLLHRKYHLIGQGLLGGGLMSLYFSVFAAGPLYHLIPLKAVFALMILVTVACCAIASVKLAPTMLAPSKTASWRIALCRSVPSR